MKSFKPVIGAKAAAATLRSVMSGPIDRISAIEMGELSRVFRFECDGEWYVAHFRDYRSAFDIARRIAEKYGGRVPVPPVVSITETDLGFCSVSRLVDGTPMSQSALERSTTIRLLVALLGDLRSIRIDEPNGLGRIDPTGTAPFGSIAAWMESVFSAEQDGFLENWTRLFSGFLERDLFVRGYDTMLDLTRYSPAEPDLVHGDFHLGNILTDGSRITGVVDWEFAMHGDFVFDVATFHVWSPQLDLPTAIRDAWETAGRPIDSFEQRMRCYTIFRALEDMRYFAAKDARKDYIFLRDKLIATLG